MLNYVLNIELLGEINIANCLEMNKCPITPLNQHKQPNSVFTGPQITQNFYPVLLTQQCVYGNNPAFFSVIQSEE